jgi:hypothetical protein
VRAGVRLPWVAVDIESTSSVEHAFEKIITRGATSLVGMARNQSEPHLPQAQMSRLTITSRDMAERVCAGGWYPPTPNHWRV